MIKSARSARGEGSIGDWGGVPYQSTCCVMAVGVARSSLAREIARVVASLDAGLLVCSALEEVRLIHAEWSERFDEEDGQSGPIPVFDDRALLGAWPLLLAGARAAPTRRTNSTNHLGYVFGHRELV